MARSRDGRRSPWLWGALGGALLAVLAGCAKPIPRYNHAREPDPRKGEFVLGPSDELAVTVWRNPDLSTTAIVRPDGTVTMPLIGDLPAEGRTPRMLRRDIESRLRDYVKDGAVVTVALTRVNSYRFTVAGKVTRVGMFAARQYLTVVEAVAMAGGPTRFANAERTTVIRRDKDGRIRRIPVDYDAIAAGHKSKQNLVVLPGDTIYVP